MAAKTSKTNFAANFPAKFTSEDVTGAWAKFLSAIEQELDLVLGSIDAFSDLWDILATDPKYLPYLSQQKGWALDVTSPVSLQRKLVQLLVPIYHEKGTAPGIISVLNTILGIQVTIKQPWAEAWRLGTDALGVGTELAAGMPLVPFTSKAPYTFYVIMPRVLTSAELAAATALITFMKRAETHFAIIQPSTEVPFFEIGCTRLGEGMIVPRRPFMAPETGDWVSDTFVHYFGRGVVQPFTDTVPGVFGALLQGARYEIVSDVDCYIRQGNYLVTAGPGDMLLAAHTVWPLTPGNPRARYIAALAVGGAGSLRITRVDTERACGTQARPPAITAVLSTDSSPGSVVPLIGNNFVNVESVLFGGVACTYVVVNANEIDATIPSGTSATGWAVQTPAGTCYFDWPPANTARAANTASFEAIRTVRAAMSSPFVNVTAPDLEPLGVRLTGVAVQPDDFFVNSWITTDNGHVWTTEDSGATWTLHNLSAWFVRCNNVWCAGGGIVYVSGDPVGALGTGPNIAKWDGTSWTGLKAVVAIGNIGECAFLSGASATDLWAAAYDQSTAFWRMMHSTDGGSTWVGEGIIPVTSPIQIAVADSTHVWVSTQQSVYQWQGVGSGFGSGVLIGAVTHLNTIGWVDVGGGSYELYVAGQVVSGDNQIFHSSDGGDTWNPESPTIPFGDEIYGVAGVSGDIFACGANGRVLWKSGAVWFDVSGSYPGQNPPTPWLACWHGDTGPRWFVGGAPPGWAFSDM